MDQILTLETQRFWKATISAAVATPTMAEIAASPVMNMAQRFSENSLKHASDGDGRHRIHHKFAPERTSKTTVGAKLEELR
jgi:Spy/CpxP family protein refolding chaperone